MPKNNLLGIDQESQRLVFWRIFETWWQRKGGSHLCKGYFWKKWPKIAIFLGKKVEIATFRPEVLTCHQYIAGFFKIYFSLWPVAKCG
jgi:hypothetical protein